MKAGGGTMKKSAVIIVIGLVVLLAGALLVKSFSTEEVEVTALGDSLAYGLGDTEDNGYIGDVEDRYEEETDKRLVVNDYGVPNDTSTDLVKRLKNKEIAETAKNSDFIFINIGTNDFIKSTDRLTKFDKEELQTNQEIYKNNLNQIIKKVQEKDLTKTIYILGIYNPKVKYADMSVVNEAILNWNRSTIQVTKDHQNVAFIRTDDLFINKNKKDYFSDNLHPNEKGYALIGKRVFDTIKLNSNYK
ncbi:GDSL-type esterase/lipase family protein [Fictibacillus arsenicus]|nr:GDSL-type esterase/lipase family protein [Fictibacillus arsenicus]